MLKRKLYSDLINWKNNHDHKCLMVLGARQVGKTYLIREFGKKEYKSFIEMNFVKNPELKSIFAGELQTEEIYKRMTAMIKNIKLIEGNTLIFLDEIQACGRARTSLKFLDEDRRYDIITSGSLLGLTYGEDADENTEEPDSIPVGYEEFLTMYSLDFEEFLWAEGYENAVPYLKEMFDKREKVPSSINEKYEKLFREYMVIGGMPEVVDNYTKNHDFAKAATIQNRILADYRADIAKHANNIEKVKVRKCYDAVPKQLAKEIKKFQYSTVEKGQTSKKYGNSIQWLKDSNFVNICYNVHEPYIPLLGNAIDEQFKLYINDTGLLCTMYGFETKRAILEKTLLGNAKGGIYENIIAETFIKNGYSLYYYKPDDSNELEFLLEKEGFVVPIEVKAGNTATKSLNRFIDKYSSKVSYKIIDGNIGVDGNKVTIPHYMAMFL